MTFTAQNEYGKIEEIAIKSISDGFVNQSEIDQHWDELGYLFRPDFPHALQEYKEFYTTIESTARKIHSFPKHDSTGIDSIYCRDASIITDHGVVLCNMGKPSRSGEPEAQAAYFQQMGIPILGRIEAPGLLEGGDTAWLDQNTLIVGIGYRTNDPGVNQLKSMVNPHGIEVLSFDLPHYHGPQDVFHLMSIFSPVDKDLAVVYSPLMPVAFRQLLIKKGYQLVEVPEEEFETMGCNVLALSPRKCLMVNGNPLTEQLLKDAGCKIISYEGQHISVAGGGGPTCLTRPIRRAST